MLLFYVIFFFLILRFAVTLFNYISNPKLAAAPLIHHDLISIIVVGSSSSKTLLPLLESIAKQQYPNYEVLVHCPNPSAAIHTFCANDSRTTLFASLPDLPRKATLNDVRHQLAVQANGRFLLFLDGPAELSDGLLNHAVHRMKVNRLQLLSLFPDEMMRSTGEWLVVPLLHFILLSIFPLRLVSLSSSPLFSVAWSQFMLFDAANYRANKGYESAPLRPDDASGMMRLLKSHGHKGETLLANGYFSCRMFSGFENALQGMSRRILPAFGYNTAAVISYLVLLTLGPLFVLFYLDYSFWVFILSLIFMGRLMISFSAGQSPWKNMLLHPLQMVALVVVGILGIGRGK